MEDNNNRISVSRETLRAELVTLELRLVEKLASEEDLEDQERRIRSLERWKYALPTSFLFSISAIIIASLAKVLGF